MALDPEGPVRRRPPWVVYYDAGPITVTSHYIETRGMRYPVAELTDVVREQGPEYPGRPIALGACLVEILLSVVVASLLGSPQLLLVGVATGAIVMGLVFAESLRNPRWYDLWARHGGRDVLLYRTRDTREFGRVCRATLRAIELNNDPRP